MKEGREVSERSDLEDVGGVARGGEGMEVSKRGRDIT